jgi:nicotinamide-nucleotide amidase
MFDRNSLEKIRDYLIANHYTLSVAESVTSGYLQAALSSVYNSTGFYQGGLTAYNLGQKTKQLDIDPIHAELHNSVSGKVAYEMALNSNKKFISDFAISITGYATPVPQLNITDLYAYFAIVKNEQLISCEKLITHKKDLIDAQLDYANQVLRIFAEVICVLDESKLTK